MKRFNIILLVLAASFCLLHGCAKVITETDNQASKRYIDAWMSLNYPEAFEAGTVCDGIWILSDEEGTGRAVGEKDLVFIESRTMTLDGEISESSLEEDARLLGTFSNGTYYGPKAADLGATTLAACVREALIGGEGLAPMKVGGKRTFISPSWLITTTYRDSAEEYFKNVTGGSHAMYEISLTGATDDILQYEVDLVEDALESNGPSAFIKELEGEDWGPVDTVGNGWGFYFRSLALPEDADSDWKEGDWKEGQEIHINYTGRLLNGKVFDTTIRDTARFYGIESASKTYGPVLATMSKTYSSITLTDNDTKVIDGFSYLIYKMRPYEKALGVFVSGRGYEATGSAPGIPGYAPLIFEVEITDVTSDE
ncbi:MAG: FKBP-type peptidyl-prolyl cis-trans isomerase [Bacteroidales bacterium]|nr:FKBP-type peptidyl-prolyl cis-trans isomerase [Bacteroidales bacterium]